MEFITFLKVLLKPNQCRIFMSVLGVLIVIMVVFLFVAMLQSEQ